MVRKKATAAENLPKLLIIEFSILTLFELIHFATR